LGGLAGFSSHFFIAPMDELSFWVILPVIFKLTGYSTCLQAPNNPFLFRLSKRYKFSSETAPLYIRVKTSIFRAMKTGQAVVA
jgi:hypothetical protein